MFSEYLLSLLSKLLHHIICLLNIEGFKQCLLVESEGWQPGALPFQFICVGLLSVSASVLCNIVYRILVLKIKYGFIKQ